LPLMMPHSRARFVRTNVWVNKVGYSSDIPLLSFTQTVLAAMRSRLLPREATSSLTSSRLSMHVLLFQRTGCPLPLRFYRAHDEPLYHASPLDPLQSAKAFQAFDGECQRCSKHNRRCLMNIDSIETSLAEAGFIVTVLDFALHPPAYKDVLTTLQAASIFVAVEGSGSVNALWLPYHRSGFLQIFPLRAGERFYRQAAEPMHPLYTEAWFVQSGAADGSRQQDVCVYNLQAGDLHNITTMLQPALISRAVKQLHRNVAAGSCVTCAVNVRTGLCENPSEYNY